MEPQHLRTQQNNYNQLAYAQWNQLPPNLPLPGTPQVHSFQLTFHSLIYLQQNKVQTPLQLSLEWWGLKQPHIMVFDSVEQLEKTAKYIVCCPVQGLLSYFNDTKVLSIDVASRNRSIGKAYLNFLLLKGWQGQKFEGYIDIKVNKKKIGELSYSIEIIKTSNPFLKIQANNEKPNNKSFNMEEKFEKRSRDSSKHKKRNNSEFSDQNDRVIQEHHFQNAYRRRQPSEKSASIKIPSQPQYIPRHTAQQRQKQLMNQYQHQQDLYEHIYEQHNLNQYQTQLVRLAEDYNLLFQRTNPLDAIQHQSDNMIEIQIVKVDLSTQEIAQQMEVFLPLLNKQKNEYKINVGGFIKVSINSTQNKEQLIDYLKNCDMEFKCLGMYSGATKLSKILSKSGQIIEIPLMFKDKKDNKLKQKGVCYIKAIPPQQQPPENPKKEQQEPKKEVEPQISFVLLSIKRYVSVQNLGRKINLFMKVTEQSTGEVLGQTKTLWNGENNISINDNVTCQTKKNQLMLQLFDRQKSDLKLGEGSIILQHPIGINLQIPVVTHYKGKRIVIGYVTLDYVKNGLNSVTKMINVFNQTGSNPLPVNTQTKSIQYSEQQSLEHDISSIQSGENENEHKNDDVAFPKHLQTAVKHFAETQIESTQKKRKQVIFERNLTELQIYNKLFTYLHQNPCILSPLDNLNDLKITEFLKIFEPITTKQILTLKQLNLLISKHIFNTQETNFVNKFNVGQFKDSYESFQTYYEELVEERDNMLKEFLSILDNVGISINDLEYEIKNNKKIWQKINEFLSFSKGQRINIVEAIRDHYQSSSIQTKDVSGAQFCDILRRFEVYETTIGEQVRQTKLSTLIYEHLCEVLVTIEPEIMNFTYRQLLALLQEQQIVLSEWELVNLEQHLRRQGKIGRALRKNQLQQYSRSTKSIKQPQQQKKQNVNGLDNKPTITKSPTFGYLHAPELYKPVLDNQEDQYMVESLANNIKQLPISPINHQSSIQNTKHLKAVFSHLRYYPTALTIDGQSINLSQVQISNYLSHNSNVSNQQISAKQYQSNKESVPDHQYRYQQASKTLKSVEEPSQKEYYSHKSQNQSRNIEISLSQLHRKFNYQVQISFQEEPEPIIVECLHEEWCSIVSEQGQYLGGLLIL